MYTTTNRGDGLVIQIDVDNGKQSILKNLEGSSTFSDLVFHEDGLSIIKQTDFNKPTSLWVLGSNNMNNWINMKSFNPIP